MTILKHKDAYINSFKRAITGEEQNISSPSVDSNSPYYAEINEENSVASFAYELGSVLSESVSSGSGAVDPQYALKDHNHDNIYAKIVHNHDDRYYTKAEEDVWRDRLINGDLLFNKINAKHIQAGTIIAGSSIIANGAIGNAHINSVSADKIDAGVIDTSKITVCGANGNLKLRGNRLQVFEGVGNEQFERVSLGDVDNDGSVYGLRVRGKDGNTILYDENGVYREGITDGSISNDKIGDDANIDGFKLNIHSVIENINDNNTGTIHGTKIDIDGEGLSSKIYDIVMDQNEHSETIKRQEAQIKQNSEEIKLKVGSQEYIEDMASMSSKLTKVESDVEILNEGIKLTASKTEVENQINNLRDFVSDEIGDISIGGANYINNSSPRKATLWDLPEWDTTINGKHRLNYWQDYNEYVELPQVGYHPHIDLDTFHFPCIALINKNGNFDMANRELSLKQELYESDKFIEEEINYVLSFDAYSDTPGFSFTGGLYHKVLESYEYNYYSGMMDITIDKEHINTWERKSYSFTTRVGIDISEPMYLVISGHNNPEGSGYIKNIKLEKGNIVSQWTPSQFDVDDSINDVVDSMKDYTNESIKTNNAILDIKFDNITSRVEYAETDLNGVKGSVSEISQRADAISSTVAGHNSKLSQIEQTSKNISLQVASLNEDVGLNRSSIELLDNQISSKVSSGDVASIIEQNPNSIKVGFNNINNNIQFNESEMQINSSTGKSLTLKYGRLNTYDDVTSRTLGYIGRSTDLSSDKQTRYPGQVFGGSYNCYYTAFGLDDKYIYDTDATGQNFDPYMTLVYWNYNGLTRGIHFNKQTDFNHAPIVTELQLRANPTGSGFQTKKLSFNSSGELTLGGTKVGGSVAWGNVTGKPSTFAPSTHTHSEYASSSHTHSNYASSSHTHNKISYNSYGMAVGSSGVINPSYGDEWIGYNRSWERMDCYDLYYTRYNGISTKAVKSDIKYLKNNNARTLSELDNNVSREDFHNFIKDIDFTTFIYDKDKAKCGREVLSRESNQEEITCGFIMEDIESINNPVVDMIVKRTKNKDGEYEKDSVYQKHIDMGSYHNSIAIALQVEIEKREQLEKRIIELEEKLKKLGDL